MKSLVLFALSAIATAAMAAGPAPESAIFITGTSVQVAALSNSTSANKAEGTNASAQQSLASNAGKVTVKGNSVQGVLASSSGITNLATSEATAQQNLSSNMGNVTVDGNSVQLVALSSSMVSNLATGRNAMAVQNIASNNACFTCN